jgi:O-antigen/teichoic acid export membrane protein
MSELGDGSDDSRSLGASARLSIVWGGGFTLLRDILQFGTMLILVRLLTPADYGSFALAQTIVGLVAVASFATFMMHALQLRDPSEVPWQIHFTAAMAINGTLFLLTLALSGLLSFFTNFAEAAPPLAVLALVFLIEIPATLRHTMLQVAHDWKRLRALLLLGCALGSAVGITVAYLGGGTWALVLNALMFGIPGAVDLMIGARWRPDWSWSWAGYREAAFFGFNRVGSAALERGRQMTAYSIMTGAFDLSTLGIFNRATGLAMLTAGRIGSVASQALYPVITRSERGSEQFQRYAALVLRGVAWTTIPAATFLAFAAADVTRILYGPAWNSVIPLLPLASIALAIAGIATAMESLLLANMEVRACLVIDIIASALGVALALWLVPKGLPIYLLGLVGHSVIVLTLTIAVLLRTRGIFAGGVIEALLPPVIAATVGFAAMEGLRMLGIAAIFLPLRVLAEGLMLMFAYLAVLRIGFARPLAELLAVAPWGRTLARLTLLPSGSVVAS